MQQLLTNLSWGLAGTGLLMFLFTIFKSPVQYGRYANRARRGIHPRNAWLIQGLPTFVLSIYFTAVHTNHRCGICANVLLCLYYIYRSFFYANRINGNSVCPLYIVIVATAFNTFTGYLQVAWNANFLLCSHTDVVNVIGCVVFGVGFLINKEADDALIALRYEGEIGYKIPKGFLFKYISCPNYLGEIIGWIGYAIAVGSPPAIAYAFYVLCTLSSRALRHHRWYLDKYPEYPMRRNAI